MKIRLLTAFLLGVTCQMPAVLAAPAHKAAAKVVKPVAKPAAKPAHKGAHPAVRKAALSPAAHKQLPSSSAVHKPPRKMAVKPGQAAAHKASVVKVNKPANAKVLATQAPARRMAQPAHTQFPVRANKAVPKKAAKPVARKLH